MNSLAVSGATIFGKAALSYAQSIAVKKISLLLDNQPSTTSDQTYDVLRRLQIQLEHKLQILTPALDLCEWIASRGNSAIDSVLTLSNDLNTSLTELSVLMDGKGKKRDLLERTFRDLLLQVDSLANFTTLALKLSGVKLGNGFPDTVSPSLVMRASHSLQQASQIAAQDHNSVEWVQVGPSFVTKFYTLFEGHAREAQRKKWSWKEQFHRSMVRLLRDASSETPAYTLEITEDLNDGRFHDGFTPEQRPDAFVAGEARCVPLHLIRRTFFTNSGKLLNIEDSRMPVFILKLILSESGDATPNPNGSRIEWIALELYSSLSEEEEEDDDDDDDDDSSEDSEESNDEASAVLSKRVVQLRLEETPTQDNQHSLSPPSTPKKTNAVFDSTNVYLHDLCFLDYLIRFASLETVEQTSHLDVCDEKLFFHLSNAASIQPGKQNDPPKRDAKASVPLHATIEKSPKVRYVSPTSKAKEKFLDRLRKSK